MYRKYAVLDFVQSMEEVPMKYKLLRRCGTGLQRWYVKKYNPFVLEKLVIADEEGYTVKLPITATDALENPDMRDMIIHNTLIALKDFRVSLLLPPRNYHHVFPDAIRIATGRHLVPFFAKQALERALRTIGKPLKNAEILVIGSDDALTMGLIDCIYPHVNYLSVMIQSIEMASVYEHIAAEIFADVGLNLQITTKNRSVLESADCIINISTTEQYDYYYRRGAAYLDFSDRAEAFQELLGKRSDLFAVNGLRVACNAQKLSLELFELAFFLKSSSYRNILQRGYQKEAAKQVMQELAAMDVRFGGFSRLGLPWR